MRRDVGRFEPFGSTLFRDSLYTFPDNFGAWLGVLLFRHSPNSPNFSHPALRREAPKISGLRSATELPRRICFLKNLWARPDLNWEPFLRQRNALPLSYAPQKLAVRTRGFEPPCPCGRYHLKVVRLPVSPRPQFFYCTTSFVFLRVSRAVFVRR